MMSFSRRGRPGVPRVRCGYPARRVVESPASLAAAFEPLLGGQFSSLRTYTSALSPLPEPTN